MYMFEQKGGHWFVITRSPTGKPAFKYYSAYNGFWDNEVAYSEERPLELDPELGWEGARLVTKLQLRVYNVPNL